MISCSPVAHLFCYLSGIFFKNHDMRNIHTLFIALFTLVTVNVKAQELDNYANNDDGNTVPRFAAGLRATPDGAGISGRFFFIPSVAVELMLNGSGGTYNDNGPSTTLVGLLEYNFLFDDPSWRIFIGAGAHMGSYKKYNDVHVPTTSIYGIDGIIGAEYIFYAVPIGISIDVKPAVNFISGVTTFPNNTFGLGVRYYFGRWPKPSVAPNMQVPKEDQRK